MPDLNITLHNILLSTLTQINILVFIQRRLLRVDTELWRQNVMMSEMMKQCCSAEGKPDFEKMKQFMEQCEKHEFNDDEVGMMKGFCGQESMPDMAKMADLMEKCGCNPE